MRVKLWLWLDPLEMARVRMLGPFKRKLDVFKRPVCDMVLGQDEEYEI